MKTIHLIETISAYLFNLFLVIAFQNVLVAEERVISWNKQSILRIGLLQVIENARASKRLNELTWQQNKLRTW